MAELTEYGFERRSRLEILQDIHQRLRDLFGPAILLTEDSVFGKIAAILAESKLEVERMAEEVYESRKLTSAEGIQLDDILNRFGVYRRGPTSSSGRAAVKYLSTVSDSVEISPTGSFASTNGKVYKPISTKNLFNAVSGLTINTSQVNVFTYTAQIVNQTTLSVENFSYEVSSDTILAKKDFLVALGQFIIDNTVDNDLIIFVVDNPDLSASLFVGYETSEQYVGISTPVTFNMNTRIGEWWSEVEVVATEAGFSPLGVGGITSYTPSFTGMLGASNGKPFDSGSEAETDAEYFQRWTESPQQAPLGTRDGVVITLLNTEGVDKVRIYDNPGIDDTPEADALSFKAIVVGGTDEDVATSIYTSKPINAGTSGSVSVPVDTIDGGVEVINFGRAIDTPVSIRITYVPRNTVLLNSTEQQAVKDSLLELISDNGIGETITNTDLEAEIYSSLSSRRLKSLLVEIKPKADPDTSYTTDDFILDFDGVASLLDGDIEFVGSL